jgi:hypothetical protein
MSFSLGFQRFSFFRCKVSNDKLLLTISIKDIIVLVTKIFSANSKAYLLSHFSAAVLMLCGDHFAKSSSV